MLYRYTPLVIIIYQIYKLFNFVKKKSYLIHLIFIFFIIMIGDIFMNIFEKIYIASEKNI